MNQMLQDPQNSETTDPPARSHPRFAKPQRIAFVQSQWHRDVVMECQTAFLTEAEARHIPRAAIDIFEVPGRSKSPCMRRSSPRRGATPRSWRPASWSMAASTAMSSSQTP